MKENPYFDAYAGQVGRSDTTRVNWGAMRSMIENFSARTNALEVTKIKSLSRTISAQHTAHR